MKNILCICITAWLLALTINANAQSYNIITSGSWSVEPSSPTTEEMTIEITYTDNQPLTNVELIPLPTKIISTTSPILWHVNKTGKLTTNIYPDLPNENKAITWQSNSPTIVSIDQNGIATAKSKGTATITATTQKNNKSTQITIIVVPHTNNATEFNSYSSENPYLLLNQDTEELTITRDEGTIDLNGHTVNKLYIQNNTLGKTITIKNGTINTIDGKSGLDDYYKGTVVLEDITVNEEIWTDGHYFEINNGTYSKINNINDIDANGTVTINGGYFLQLVDNDSHNGKYIINGGNFNVNPNALNSIYIEIANGKEVTNNGADDNYKYEVKDATALPLPTLIPNGTNSWSFSMPNYDIEVRETKTAIEPYVTLTTESGKPTLTFYYDNNRSNHENNGISTYTIDENLLWRTDANKATITQIIIDESFANYRPTSCAYWFSEFKSLSNINDLSNLNTESVTNMAGMFCNSFSLTSLDLSHFNTSKVSDMSFMFYGCRFLEHLDASSFITTEVTTMSCMFFDSGLITLDICNFSLNKNINLEWMFSSCDALTTIYVNQSWDQSKIIKSTCMFENCFKLIGGNGTKYEEPLWGASRAIIDGENGQQGYFTYIDHNEPYITLTTEPEGSILTFYYDDKKSKHESNGIITFTIDNNLLWHTNDNKEKVTQVKFAKSFADYHPTSYADWFNGFENVTYFNVDSLNTSDVTDMSNMFRNCKSATYFSGAYNLEISKVENMSGMFQNCSSVYVIHLGRSERNAITNTSKMFDGCKNLTTIISSLDFSSIENLIDDDMFAGCISLIGENETSFKSDNPSGKTYAHLDQGSKNPGYFTAFDGVNHQDFHIFYDLNDDKESPAKLDELAPKAFGYGMGQDDFPIYLIEPTREGYIFKGWSLTIGDNTMENVTQISQDSSVIIGNRLFVAQWQQIIIVEDGSIKQEPFEQYCAKPFGNVELSFKVVQGKPTHYSITVPNQSSLSQSGKVIDEGNKTYKIEIDVPSQTEPGIYDGTITFYDNEQLSVPLTQPLGFKLTVYIPKDVIKQLYYNVIFVDNHDSIYIGYQWRKNGDKTTNEYANRQYYYEKELSGQYTVDLTTKSGAILTSCPVGDDNLAKQLSPTVTPYPNPAKAGVPFNLKLIGGVPENASIMIFNNAGAQVMRIDNVNEYTTITLPRGFYSGALIYDGQKSGFKIIVE